MRKPVIKIKQRIGEENLNRSIFTVTIPGIASGCFVSDGVKRASNWMVRSKKIVSDIKSGKKNIQRKKDLVD